MLRTLRIRVFFTVCTFVVAEKGRETNRRKKRNIDSNTDSFDIDVANVDPISLAVDWVGNNLYWIDGNFGKPIIMIADLKGLVRQRIATNFLHKPQAIVLDPVRG